MIRAKKSLGQNFLTDQNVIDKIVNILDLKKVSQPIITERHLK